MRLIDLEERLVLHLATPITVVGSNTWAETTPLNSAERKRLDGFTHINRRRDWLCGRNALKQLLAELNLDTDTSTITFPDRQVSMTHADGIAIACGLRMKFQGVGIDYEPCREVNHRISRWFLNDVELTWLFKQPDHDRLTHIFRLWTIKEAAFKSHPGNAGMSLTDFTIDSPARDVTQVIATKTGACIQAACLPFEAGYLSVALFEESK